MRKQIFYLLTLLILATTVMAFNMPHPIYGHIDKGEFPVKDVKILVENLDSGAEKETITDGNGFFMADLGNFDSKYRDEDRIKVSLIFCKELPECSKTVEVSGGGNEVSWQMETIAATLPVESVIVKHTCWDGAKVSSETDCLPMPEPKPEPTPEPETIVETVYEKCESGKIVTDIKDCEVEDGEPVVNDNWLYLIIGILATIFGGLLGGGGWKFYRGKFKHYHRGIKGYHDPNDRHRNPKYRHALWKDSAIGCIKDVNKIQKGLDLSDEE